MLTAARFWPQRWLAVRTMLQDLIEINGSWKCFFLAWLIAVKTFVNDLPSVERRNLLSFFIVLRSCGRKISLYMCHGNSENSNSGTYFLRICSIYGTNLSELRSWKPQQVVDREENAFFIAVQGIFVGIIIKASAASLKVTDLSFYFRVSPRWLFVVC